MTPLQTYITKGLLYTECQIGNPTFTWNNTAYVFVGSISLFERQLEFGGYEQKKMLSGTVRINDCNGVSRFGEGYPTAQQIITSSVDGLQYRIETIKFDITKSYFRIIAVSTNRGI